NTLTADTSGITSPVPGALAYQWFINGAPISGATGPAYTPTESDVGRPLTVTVTAANYSGGLTSAPVTVLKPGPSGVPYLDANGQPQIAYDAAALTGSETTLTTGWYVANGTLDFGNIIISGDVHLILADGCDMTATGTGPDAAINVAPGNSLTIYAQSSDPATMGSLTANAYSGAGIGGNQGGADNGGVGNGQDCGTVTINGGNITIPYHYGTGIGGGDGGKVSGNGGSGGTVTINGGYSIIRGIHGIGVGPNGGSGFGGTGGSVLITGGTVFTSSIYTDLYPDPNVVITGGNVRASIVPAPSGVDGKKLYEFEVSGLPVGAAVSAISADGAAYGSNCVWTDDSSLSYNDGSNLSLWLPSDTNSISLTVGGQVYDYYVVTVTTNNGYVLTSPYGKTPLLAGSSPVFTITLYPGYVLSSLTDNGADVTDQVVDGTYTILNLSGTHALTVSTEALPIPDVSHFSFAPHSTPYNGSPQSVIVYCDLSGVGEIQHIFYNGSETIPAEPGDYAIKIYVYPSAEYGGGFYDLGTYTITPPAPPALEGTVSIGGTPQAGMTLTADTNITSPDTGALSYQWFIDGAPITDATGPTYAPTASDAGKALTVTVIAANYSGSLISAPVTVAVAAFALTVVNGTDDTNAGPYAAGTPVSITAGQAPAGQVFDRWTGGNGGAFADVYGMTTTFTMPANAATVTATYKAAPPATYALTVVNGADDTNAGPYTAGTSVSITADPAPAGQVFDRWTGGNGGAFADAYSMTTVFTMPANAATISATYKNAPPATYALTVVNGVDVTGDGNYAAGVAVSIMADPAPAGMVFDRWTGGNGGAFADAYNMTTTFTMPANAATVSATYKNAPPATYALTVVNGVDITGDGNYAAGVSVSIMADPAPNGMAFDSWTGGNGGAFADLHSMTTAFTMPANAATVSATYKNAAAPVTLSAAALPAAVTLGAAPQTLKAFATLSGGTNPTGNIVFNLLYAGTALVEMETIPVTGNGTYTTPVGYTLPADGTYSSLYTWKVSYSGDAYNSAAAAACDVHVTSPAAPALTLTAAPSHLQTYPGGITLTAALSGAYPGNSGKMILFRMNGSVLSSLQTGPDGSVSFTIPAQANGTYSFDATYYGDAHNAEADAEAVSYTVNRATPVIAGADGLTAKSGQTLANVDLSGVTAKSGAAAVPGVFTWEQSASSSVGPVGTNTSFTLTFTPNDAANYVTVTGIHASILVTAADNPPPGTLVCNVKSMAAKIGKPVAIPFTWDGAGALVFTSSNAAVCSVSQSGTLTPLKAGIAVITITTPAGDKVVFAVTVTA
ncbi:MAG: Ig-like domain repeat protein, partial [Firmicutes bacterium]|nr:Ig-like domain repeat protein [Bacillota bacterium]